LFAECEATCQTNKNNARHAVDYQLTTLGAIKPVRDVTCCPCDTAKNNKGGDDENYAEHDDL